MLVRGGASVLGLGVLAALVVAGATALRNRARAGVATQARPANPTDSRSLAAGTDSGTTASLTAGGSSALVTMASAATPAPIVPIIPVGRTALRDTMVAERAGDTVRVSFDLLLSRTRRPEKFEAIMRATLPQVYGAPVDSALRALPVGAVARAGDLVTTLPQRGFRIPLPSGRTIAVWPETRAGRDGPLVVAYRAVASR